MMLLTAEGEQAEIKLNSCPISHTSSSPAYFATESYEYAQWELGAQGKNKIRERKEQTEGLLHPCFYVIFHPTCAKHTLHVTCNGGGKGSLRKDDMSETIDLPLSVTNSFHVSVRPRIP